MKDFVTICPFYLNTQESNYQFIRIQLYAYRCRYDTDRNGYVDYREFIARLGVEFASGDTDGHSRRIIEESYDTIMPEFRNKVTNFTLLTSQLHNF